MKDEPLDQRLQIVASRDFVRRVDDWRREQPDIPSRSEAIRRLVERGVIQRRHTNALTELFRLITPFIDSGKAFSAKERATFAKLVGEITAEELALGIRLRSPDDGEASSAKRTG